MAKQPFSIRNIFYIILFILPFLGIAQQNSDSLQNFSYDELAKKFEQHPEHTKVYADAYLKKAKKEKDSLQMVKGYELKSAISKGEMRANYSDSVILFSKNVNNQQHLALAYLRKGTVYYTNRNFKKALDNYLKALEYNELNNNQERAMIIKYNIALLKDRIGEYQEALILEKSILKHKDEISHNFFLNTTFLIATTYRNLSVLDSSSSYNKTGLEESKKANDDLFQSFFLLNEALVDYEKVNYQKAFDSIKKSIPLLKKTKNLPNLAIAYNYLGKLYLQNKEEALAIANFKKTDSIFNIINDLHPVARSAYEDLITYYKKEKNTEQQLKYVNQLLKLDSILSSNSIYISKRITKEYDIPKLEAEKDKLALQLKNNQKKASSKTWIFISILLFILSAFYYQYKKRLLTKKRFEELLIQQNISTSKKEVSIKKEKTSPIPKHIAQPILEQLIVFEKEKEFTTLGLSSQILAKNLGTNTHYLSNVINHYKEQSFVNYLNNLRIEYTIERIKNDLVFRKYTIDAIANEVGFQNTSTFYKAFSKKTGITPSFFIKELNKKENT